MKRIPTTHISIHKKNPGVLTMTAKNSHSITRISTIILIMGMLGVHNVTARWNGHQQRNELRIIVDSNIFTLQRHQIAEEVRHVVFHALPAMIEVSVHVDPQEQPGQNLHQITTHHVPGQIENKN